MNFFEKANQWIENTETSIVNVVSAFSPWLAPLIPAYLSYVHTQTFLNFPEPMAFITALVIEFLGLSTISTSLKFYKHNQRYKADKNKSPFWLAILAFVFYLSVVLVVNVVLSSGTYETKALIAVTLLTTLSIPAAVTIAARSQHEELKTEIKERHTTALPVKKKESKATKKFPNDWRKLSENQKDQVKGMTVEEIMHLGIIERTARNWKVYSKNGHKEIETASAD